MNDVFIRLSVALLIVNIPIECLEERVEKIGRLMGVRVVGVTLDQGEDRLDRRVARAHVMRCGATMLMNSRDVITLVFFQNLGKCRWFPVTR